MTDPPHEPLFPNDPGAAHEAPDRATPEPDSPEPDAPDAPLVRVVVERGLDTRSTRDTLVYRDPTASLTVGDRVRVPLGRSSAEGVVVRTAGVPCPPNLSPDRLRPVTEPTGTRLDPALIHLAEWMAGYYLCPMGMVLATMLPASVKKGVGRRSVTLLEPAAPDALTQPPPSPLAPSAEAARIALAALPPEAFPAPAADLAERAGAHNKGPINRLLAAGLLREITVQQVRTKGTLHEHHVERSAAPELTPEQSAAAAGIIDTLGTFAPHLLHGITGSGKTEVYLAAIEATLERAQTAIMLVPEIALTPQTAERFTSRLGRDTVAVLHSGLTASQRHAEWARLAEGSRRVAIGARSAVFSPLANLGLIIVDEEHDSSYKQDQLPRYHARDVAIKRAQLQSAAVVLGSATPSLESWHNATRSGARFRLWRLTERVAGGRLPAVTIADLAREPRPPKGHHPPSVATRLARELRSTLDRNEQAILLLNRRGFASYLGCADHRCGWSLRCDHCDAGLVVHRRGHGTSPAYRKEHLRCHHCLAEQLAPPKCPLCAKAVVRLGAGTQRVEDELAREFDLEPGRDFERVDSDSMRTGSDYFRVLDRFARGDLRVLLGTQMIAKGLDFPAVTLVGVLSADTAINLPDFRAAERTFQLVSQVAGRAGRASANARVIVQTFNPTAEPITLAAAHDYDRFAKRELAFRREAQLPPITRMARVVSRHADAAKAESAAATVAGEARRLARQLDLSRVRIDGPMPCPIARVADRFRFCVELTAPDAGSLQTLLAALRTEAGVHASDSLAIDVDPVAMM